MTKLRKIFFLSCFSKRSKISIETTTFQNVQKTDFSNSFELNYQELHRSLWILTLPYIFWNIVLISLFLNFWMPEYISFFPYKIIFENDNREIIEDCDNHFHGFPRDPRRSGVCRRIAKSSEGAKCKRMCTITRYSNGILWFWSCILMRLRADKKSTMVHEKQNSMVWTVEWTLIFYESWSNIYVASYVNMYDVCMILSCFLYMIFQTQWSGVSVENGTFEILWHLEIGMHSKMFIGCVIFMICNVYYASQKYMI